MQPFKMSSIIKLRRVDMVTEKGLQNSMYSAIVKRLKILFTVGYCFYLKYVCSNMYVCNKICMYVIKYLYINRKKLHGGKSFFA